ncbi:MAG TPA: malectin domain-containing carbohydrate-binding protein, partial [Verrucomicrobiae bacterium]|nr:malectin domain-containing carbohydrate-binding protein [Verrucomicrobiae bacterium]
GVLILFGALQMLRLRSYAWALAAAILSIVACSLIGLPMGIWALIVLARPDVRETFANAARSESPKLNLWPWALGTALVAGLFILIALGLNLAGETRNVTVSGTVTDAATGQPIAGARVDDSRNGADPNKAPAQSGTDTDGNYELETWYEEHTIAASAPGYNSKSSTLRTKAFGSERNVSMNFRLQPESRTSLPNAASEEQTGDSLPKESAMQVPPVPPIPAAPSSATSMAANAAVAPVSPPVRIKAGSFKSFVDHDGNLWLPDRGFADGETAERPHLAVVNTKDPELYCTERYGMTSFSYPVPNGQYMVKLHFAETYDAITGPGQRVFTFIIEGREFKNFDIWAEAGGAQRALVQTVNVEVSDGTLNINFIPGQQNPEINGIEILPVSLATAAVEMRPPPKATETPGDPSLSPGKSIGNLSTTDPFQQDFNETLPLSARGRFHLDNVNGRIEIAGWDRNEVVIKALKHGRTRESVETSKVKVDASADEISIHTEGPPNETGVPGIWSWFKNGENNKATVDYAVQVPRHARLANIASVNGRIGIDDVGGDIEASTVNGTVEVQHVAGSLKLSTVNGRIDAKLISLGGDQSVSLSTVNGAIEATLPANADAEVTADTVNGGMSSEFPALVVKKDFPLSKHLKGALGNGGATVKATTVNGSIRFRRGNDAP